MFGGRFARSRASARPLPIAVPIFRPCSPGSRGLGIGQRDSHALEACRLRLRPRFEVRYLVALPQKRLGDDSGAIRQVQILRLFEREIDDRVAAPVLAAACALACSALR